MYILSFKAKNFIYK